MSAHPTWFSKFFRAYWHQASPKGQVLYGSRYKGSDFANLLTDWIAQHTSDTQSASIVDAVILKRLRDGSRPPTPLQLQAIWNILELNLTQRLELGEAACLDWEATDRYGWYIATTQEVAAIREHLDHEGRGFTSYSLQADLAFANDVNRTEMLRGNRYMVLDGFSINTLSENIMRARAQTSEQAIHELRTRVSAQRAYIDQLTSGKFLFRDLISERGLLRYAHTGSTSIGDFLDERGAKRSTPEQRIEHLVYVKQLIRINSYEIGLFDELPEIGSMLVLLKEDRSCGRWTVLTETIEDDYYEGQLIRNEALVRLFRSLFDQAWNKLPAERKDKNGYVMPFIDNLINIAKSFI